MTNESLVHGLSAILMGRNEERFLPLSLPPLQRVADEIVFVDTGSTDRTLEIVRDFGCRILHLPWNNDFSAPKNLALSHSRFQWILNVDCDEVLVDDEGFRERILNQCLAEEEPAWIIQIDNRMVDGRIHPSKALRLFRNDPRIRFANPVHEGIADSLYRHWPHRPPREIEVRLVHHGYASGFNKQKIQRNVTILRQWITNDPDSVYGRYKLGMNLRFLGLASEGLFHLGEAIALADKDADRNSLTFLEELVATCFQAYMEAGQQDKAEQLKQIVGQWG
ncbi:MAG: glycosyltransferase family 2 protein [Magnetococcales bacterium]|nr:glycosyltransferase family 2 protein [Magnetococcales bacterium]MBF0438978.1 glycosyltransferase family 2 protein [Magnetococcales bacterium]